MASCKLTLKAAFLLPARCVAASCLALCWLAYAQVSYPDKEIHVHDLPSLTARSTHPMCWRHRWKSFSTTRKFAAGRILLLKTASRHLIPSH